MKLFERFTKPLSKKEYSAAEYIFKEMLNHAGKENKIISDRLWLIIKPQMEEDGIEFKSYGEYKKEIDYARSLITRLVKQMRKDVIMPNLVGSGDGYYLGITADEIQDGIESMSQRGISSISISNKMLEGVKKGECIIPDNIPVDTDLFNMDMGKLYNSNREFIKENHKTSWDIIDDVENNKANSLLDYWDIFDDISIDDTSNQKIIDTFGNFRNRPIYDKYMVFVNYFTSDGIYRKISVETAERLYKITGRFDNLPRIKITKIAIRLINRYANDRIYNIGHWYES